MKKVTSSREVLIVELIDQIDTAIQNAKQRRIDVEKIYWDEVLANYNKKGAAKRFFKRQYTMEQVKEIHQRSGFSFHDYEFTQHFIDENLRQFYVLKRLCTDNFTSKTVRLTAEDNNLVSFYVEKRFNDHETRT